MNNNNNNNNEEGEGWMVNIEQINNNNQNEVNNNPPPDPAAEEEQEGNDEQPDTNDNAQAPANTQAVLESDKIYIVFGNGSETALDALHVPNILNLRLVVDSIDKFTDSNKKNKLRVEDVVKDYRKIYGNNVQFCWAKSSALNCTVDVISEQELTKDKGPLISLIVRHGSTKLLPGKTITRLEQSQARLNKIRIEHPDVHEEVEELLQRRIDTPDSPPPSPIGGGQFHFEEDTNNKMGWWKKFLLVLSVVGFIGIITALVYAFVLCQEGTSAVTTYTPPVKKVWRGISTFSRTTASSVWDKWPLCLGDSLSDTSDANKKNDCLIILPFSSDIIKRIEYSDNDMLPRDKYCTSELIDVNQQCHLPGNFVDLVVLPVHVSKVQEMKELGTSLMGEVNGLKQSEIKLKDEVLDFKGQLNDAEKKLNVMKGEKQQLKVDLLVAEEEQRQAKKRLEAEKDSLEETNTSLRDDNQDLRVQVSQLQVKITSLGDDKQDLESQVVLLYWVMLGIIVLYPVIIGLYYNRWKLFGGKVMPGSEELSENTEKSPKGDGGIVEGTTGNSVETVSRGDNGPNLATESSSTTTGDNTSTTEEDEKENHPPTVKKGFRGMYGIRSLQY